VLFENSELVLPTSCEKADIVVSGKKLFDIEDEEIKSPENTSNSCKNLYKQSLSPAELFKTSEYLFILDYCISSLVLTVH
jgi:hypothetical protein